MSEASKYFDLITHDLKLFDLLTGKMPKHLAEEDFSDWHVTVLFYMACIYLCVTVWSFLKQNNVSNIPSIEVEGLLNRH
jgi:hypothetical protein